MKYCFLFGAPRSGTTFLMSILGKGRSVEGVTGRLLPVSTCHIVNQDISDDVRRVLAKSIKDNIWDYLVGVYNSRFRALEDWWRAPLQIGRLRDVLRRGEREWPDWFLYKEPFLSFCPELIWEALPNAKIIYIHRDGRDVANSLVESYDALSDEALVQRRGDELYFGREYDRRFVPWWVEEGEDDAFIQSSQYARAIWMWKHMVERCQKFFEDIESGESSRLLRIQYETLVRHPHAVGDQILDFIDLGDTRAFRRQLSRARTTSIGKHEQRPEEERQRAVSLAREALEMLDYV